MQIVKMFMRKTFPLKISTVSKLLNSTHNLLSWYITASLEPMLFLALNERLYPVTFILLLEKFSENDSTQNSDLQLVWLAVSD